MPEREIVRRPFFAWGNVPETLNVALTLPECALKVEAEADDAERSSEANTIEAMSPNRIGAVGLDNVDPFRIVELKLSDVIFITCDVLSTAGNKLQMDLNNHVLGFWSTAQKMKLPSWLKRTRQPSFD